ncbi:MAG: hypothetical protein WAZ77_09355 [Candidatus Nitrosopolaris sp.]
MNLTYIDSLNRYIVLCYYKALLGFPERVISTEPKKAIKEILFIFPTSNAFFRQRKMGAIGFAENAAIERNVKIRILMPSNKLAYETILKIRENWPGHIGIRYNEQMSDTKATILVMDRKESLLWNNVPQCCTL